VLRSEAAMNVPPVAYFLFVTLVALAKFVAGAAWPTLLAVIVLFVALWHALVVIDFDWRYRLPVLPYLILMAACAIPSTKSRLPPWDGQ